MLILAVTDIPRMTSLFEQFEGTNTEIILATDIHRAIDQFDNRNPNLVIFQNYLSGFSADILYKHFASRLNGRDIRFVLISNRPEDAGLEQFEAVLDSNGSTAALESALAQLIIGTSPLCEESDEHPQDASNPTEVPLLPLSQQTNSEFDDDSGIYSRPASSSKPAIISDFSLQLSETSDEIRRQHKAEDNYYLVTGAHSDSFEPEVEITEMVNSRLRSPTIWLIGSTLLIVVAISLLQHRSSKDVTDQKPENPLAIQVAISSNRPLATRPVVPATPHQDPIKHQPWLPARLPEFIPSGNADKQYAKAHPGWELYRGQTNEYRVYRDKDAKIKAIQVLDRSGAGIQEAFFMQALKELAGDTSINQATTETKEGYEIKRGLIAGMQLVQYRDAQGGRLRGFVVTWP